MIFKIKDTVAKRRGLIYFNSEAFRGDRRGLLKAIALLQRRWEALSDLKYINPDEIWRMAQDNNYIKYENKGD